MSINVCKRNARIMRVFLEKREDRAEICDRISEKGKKEEEEVMPRKNRLNLMNDRGTIGAPIPSCRVYDSIDSPPSKFGNERGVAKFPPLNEEPEIIDMRNFCYSTLTSRGDPVEIADIIESRPTSVNYDARRSETEWDVRLNDVKKIWRAAVVRPRVNTPSMNKIVDRGSAPDYPGMWDLIVAGKAGPAKISNAPRNTMQVPSSAPSVQYDVDQWYRGKYGPKTVSVIFSTEKKGRGNDTLNEVSLPPMTPEETARLRELEDRREPSKTARVAKFDDIPRFQPHIKEEGYKKGGIPLSPDFDRYEGWEKYPVKFNNAKRDANKPQSATALISREYKVDVDYGNAASLGVAVAKSPITYRSAFTGKGNMHSFGSSETGPNTGPGKYADAYKDSIVIKEPNKRSLMFQRDGHIPRRFKTPDPQFVYTEFGEGSKAFIIPKSGSRPPSHLRMEAVQNAIKNMHPRLASKMYSHPIKVSDSIRKVVVTR